MTLLKTTGNCVSCTKLFQTVLSSALTSLWPHSVWQISFYFYHLPLSCFFSLFLLFRSPWGFSLMKRTMSSFFIINCISLSFYLYSPSSSPLNCVKILIILLGKFLFVGFITVYGLCFGHVTNNCLTWSSTVSFWMF